MTEPVSATHAGNGTDLPDAPCMAPGKRNQNKAMDMKLPIRKRLFDVIFRMLPTMLVVVLLLAATSHGAMLYKNYIVRVDRGWDILCDPYQVQRGDWVLKIFRQKGEIAHEDFREFLGIFQRLNPHVKDINRIRIGQIVDIPLKKLAQGSLPGQSSGMVTIPFVMINNPREMIQKHAKTYTVQKGDTVSKLIANQFGGRYGNLTYKQGIKLFKSVNPHIKNINRIYAGEKIHMPDPSIRQQEWYANLFDKEGNLVEKVQEKGAGKEPAASASVRPSAPAPTVQPPKASGPVGQAATIIGGRLMNKGTYFLPMKDESEFELDLSRYPMIDLGNGTKVVLSSKDKVMNVELPLIQSYWEDVKVVRIPDEASSGQIVEAVFASFSKEDFTNQLSFEDGAVTVQVGAKWIRTEPNGGGSLPRHTCITPIASESERTHEAIVRYLSQNDIILNELIKGEVEAATPVIPVHDLNTTGNIDGRSHKALVRSFAASMKFSYSPNTAISFPYAGIQVKALSNLLSFGNGREILIDFGDLYGDAITAIKATGLSIMQINVEDDPVEVLQQLMTASGLAHTNAPVYYAADRTDEYNTVITINGLLIPTNIGEQRLYIARPMPELVELFLRDQGIRLVRISGNHQG